MYLRASPALCARAMLDINASEILMRVPSDRRYLSRGTAPVIVPLLMNPGSGLDASAFLAYLYTLVVYDAHSASGLCSYKAHVYLRGCERVSFLGTHDSAPGDIKSETVVARTPFGV